MNEPIIAHIDYAPAPGCSNSDTYGEICVKCNQCGRFNEPTQKKGEIIMCNTALAEEAKEQSASSQPSGGQPLKGQLASPQPPEGQPLHQRTTNEKALAQTLPQEAKDQLAAAIQGNQEIVKQPQQALSVPEAKKAILDLFKDKAPAIEQLPKIKIIHEAQMFQMPGELAVKEIRGCIIDQYKCNAYWEKRENEDEISPPLCKSYDSIKPAITSQKIQCEKGCALCPMNQFQKDEEENWFKMCKNMRRLFLMVGDFQLPLQLSCPPKSIPAFSDFSTDIMGAGWPYQAGNVKLTLDRETKGKAVYSILKIATTSIEQDIEACRKRLQVADQFETIIHEQDITFDDYIPNITGDSNE